MIPFLQHVHPCVRHVHMKHTLKKPQEEHMQVLTVVLSKGHNSGNFNFLLFVFSDHVLICFGKMTKHLKTSHYLKKAA